MSGRRAPIRNSSINYGNFSSNDFSTSKPKGTKPTPGGTTVVDFFLETLVKISNTYLTLNINYRIATYLGILFLVSIIGDVLPYPKTYLSQSNHFLNQYFVKLGWGWTLITTIPFVVMTSYTYCCSDRFKVGMHLVRLGIGTFFWLFWTNTFLYIESIYGRCSNDRLTMRSKCLAAGAKWTGFDISGHSFLLIYSVLLIIEEAKPIYGWTSIQTSIDLEKHSRSNNEKSGKSLQSLTLTELINTEKNFKDFRRFVCINFIAMTIIVVIWDLMVLTTAMYYHSMMEKFVSGLIAIVTWFVTYRFWYPSVRIPPPPGDGNFKYFERKDGLSSMNGVTKSPFKK